MSSESLHEPRELMPPELIDRHRAIASIMEELEAVDWYDQRAAVATDPELVDVLGHNRDEEKEHAAMTLEWLRRNDPVLDRHLRTYLFTEGSILGIEEVAEHGGGEPAESAVTPSPSGGAGSLGIGSLRGSENT
jgi:ferritin-like protein